MSTTRCTREVVSESLSSADAQMFETVIDDLCAECDGQSSAQLFKVSSLPIRVSAKLETFSFAEIKIVALRNDRSDLISTTKLDTIANLVANLPAKTVGDGVVYLCARRGFFLKT